MADVKQAIEGEVLSTRDLELQLNTLQQELSSNPTFQQFLEVRAALNAKYTEVRKNIEAVMVPAYQAGDIDKSIKGEWGSVTVTETDTFKIDEDVLPAKFWKRVPDTTKIRKTYQLEGKAPKGTEQSTRYGIMLKLKNQEASDGGTESIS